MADPQPAIKIEGNTDERGSAGYNRAWGQKRAQAAEQALKTYGVKDTQLEAISWSREKPEAAGHDESAWAQKRRALSLAGAAASAEPSDGKGRGSGDEKCGTE
ncbi:MAG: OmpA family protein [Burkholderiales bacterium]